MLAAMRKFLDDNIGKYAGDKDFLEGVCASCSLVAAADGNVDDDEVAATAHAIASNAILSKAFKPREIEQVANEMLRRAGGGRMGRAGLMKEIEEVADKGDADKNEAILYAAIDVAEADGNIDDKEHAVLEKISSVLNVDLKKALDA